MASVIKFVDSIAASPTVRLDLNDGSTWTTRDFNAPPPRLRRAVGSNAMSNGAFVSASSYDARVVTLDLLQVSSSQDTSATQLQLLARELDRADNYLMYQPNGLTKPVFFIVKRSDYSGLREVNGQTAAREGTVELWCEPFALGLRETLGPYTVNNDPAAGSNGHYFDVTGVIGDVAAECVVSDTGTHRGGGWLSVRQHGTPSDMTLFVQAESATAGTDTANPGGGPDAAMSGAGTNNYLRTSFTSVAMETRVTYTASLSDAAGLALAGEYRLLAVVRRTDNTSVMTMNAVAGSIDSGTQGSTVTVPLSTSRQVVDLGVFTFRPPVERVGKYNTAQIPVTTVTVLLNAARASGSGNLDWDYFMLVPADESCLAFGSAYTSRAQELVVDGLNECVYLTESGVDPFASTSSVTDGMFDLSGGFPKLVPGRTNRFVYVAAEFATSTHVITKADVGTVSVNYWPNYLHVRPSAT